jgi:hypothetical protein
LTGWRDDGHGADEVELWVVGYPGSDDSIPAFANGSEAPCLPDEGYAVYFSFDAGKDDLYVVDQSGNLVFYSDLGVKPLYSAANRDEVDTVVRGLLP